MQCKQWNITSAVTCIALGLLQTSGRQRVDLNHNVGNEQFSAAAALPALYISRLQIRSSGDTSPTPPLLLHEL